MRLPLPLRLPDFAFAFAFSSPAVPCFPLHAQSGNLRLRTYFLGSAHLADVQRVQDLLDQLRRPAKPKDDPLKQLIWRELEYERVNQPLSRQGWTEPASSVLAGDPVLFAKGGEQFQIIYARLKSDELRRRLRACLSSPKR